MDAAAFFDLVSKLTVSGVLALAIIALVRGWLVTKREYDAREREHETSRQRDAARIAALESEAEEWQGRALAAWGVTRDAVSLTERAIRGGPNREGTGGTS